LKTSLSHGSLRHQARRFQEQVQLQLSSSHAARRSLQTSSYCLSIKRSLKTSLSHGSLRHQARRFQEQVQLQLSSSHAARRSLQTSSYCLSIKRSLKTSLSHGTEVGSRNQTEDRIQKNTFFLQTTDFRLPTLKPLCLRRYSLYLYLA
jgi:hypothetical protein